MKILLRLIGDAFFDRGPNDWFTFKFLERLDQLGIPIRLMISNHGINIIYWIETSGKCGEMGSEVSSSWLRMRRLIDLGLINKGEIENIYVKVIAPNLELIGFECTEEGAPCTIYSHAPALLQSVFYTAKLLDVGLFGFNSAERGAEEQLQTFMRYVTTMQLSSIIANINAQISRFAEGNILHQAIPALFHSVRPGDLYNEPILPRNPISQLIWSFCFKLSDYQLSADTQARLQMLVVHGHNGRSVTMVMGEVSPGRLENTSLSTYASHVGLDTPVAKKRASCLNKWHPDLKYGNKGILMVYINRGRVNPDFNPGKGTYCHITHHKRSVWIKDHLKTVPNSTNYRSNTSTVATRGEFVTDISVYPRYGRRFLMVPPIPSELEQQAQPSCTIGDTHGRVMRIVHFAIAHGFIEMRKSEFDNLNGMMLWFWSDDNYQNKCALETALTNYTKILRSIVAGRRAPQLASFEVLFRLIGDVFADVGPNDWATLLLLERLMDLGIPMCLLFSNHGQNFIYFVETGKPMPSASDAVSGSLKRMQKMIDLGVITLEKVREKYKKVIAPILALVDIECNEQQGALFSHAPALLQSVFHAAKRFAINFPAGKDTLEIFLNSISRQELAGLVAGINGKMQAAAKNASLAMTYQFLFAQHQLGGFPELFEVAAPADNFVDQLCWTFNLPKEEYVQSAEAQLRLNLHIVHGHSGHARVGILEGKNGPTQFYPDATHTCIDTQVGKGRDACLEGNDDKKGNRGELIVFVGQGGCIVGDGSYVHKTHRAITIHTLRKSGVEVASPARLAGNRTTLAGARHVPFRAASTVTMPAVRSSGGGAKAGGCCGVGS